MKFASPTVTDLQKSRLFACYPFGESLFGFLKQVVSEFEGASATSSHINLSDAISKGLLFSNKRKREDSPVASTSSVSPVVPPGSSGSGSKQDVSSLFTSGSKGRGYRKGGRGTQRDRGASTSQKSQGRGFAK